MMRSKSLLYLWLLTGLTTGCAYVENYFEAVEFRVEIPERTYLKIAEGEVEPMAEGAGIKRVFFRAVRGGETYLFGLIKVREANGYTAKRLRWLDERGQLIKAYSVMDLKAMRSGEGRIVLTP